MKTVFLAGYSALTELMTAAFADAQKRTKQVQFGPGVKNHHKGIDPRTYREAYFDDTPSDQVSRQALRSFEHELAKSEKAEIRSAERRAKQRLRKLAQRERELNGFYTGLPVGELVGKENRRSGFFRRGAFK
jgi:nucleotidyltransferase/DNA polymerase involved in DNA repair